MYPIRGEREQQDADGTQKSRVVHGRDSQLLGFDGPGHRFRIS